MHGLTSFQDQVFSQQDKRQLIGRIWRHPQERRCIIYDLIALETADVVLNHMARTKREMLDVFTGNGHGEGKTFSTYVLGFRAQRLVVALKIC